MWLPFCANVLFEAKEVGEISEETRYLREKKKNDALPFKIDKTDSEYVYVKIYAYGPDLEGNI